MNKFSLLIFSSLLINLTACEKSENKNMNEGTLQGNIGIYTGNCMPVNSCEPMPLSTAVVVTLPSSEFNQTLVIDSVLSSTDGSYSINLPSGNYSIFLRDTAGFVCDYTLCLTDCYCTYFKITNDSVTIVNANLDHATW